MIKDILKSKLTQTLVKESNQPTFINQISVNSTLIDHTNNDVSEIKIVAKPDKLDQSSSHKHKLEYSHGL